MVVCAGRESEDSVLGGGGGGGSSSPLLSQDGSQDPSEHKMYFLRCFADGFTRSPDLAQVPLRDIPPGGSNVTVAYQVLDGTVDGFEPPASSTLRQS